jgi:L-alanine-DL-glutamate epimerase-like enolase superfamily enzyme
LFVKVKYYTCAFRFPLILENPPIPPMALSFTLTSVRFHVLPMRTRFPFKYGIASMSALPHPFVSVDLTVEGKPASGLASEGLPPKWFTKDPTTLFEQDLAEMLAAIQNAARIGRNAAQHPIAFFKWWKDLYDEQTSWAQHREVPPLLAHLGTSLIERAVLDALCKAAGQPLHRLLRDPRLGIDLGAVRSQLAGISVDQILPPKPLDAIHVRHTIGLGDPLRGSEIAPAERLNDGLPHALDESIRAYGLSYFKIKISGQPDADRARLLDIAAVLDRECRQSYHCTLDGNENYHDLDSFRAMYEQLRAEPALDRLFASLLLIEQPIHRNQALAQPVDTWRDGPPLIIDESDGALLDLPRALELGYRGVSHKNCKGIIKGLANLALLQQHPGTVLSGEDLANVGPVALLQDLAVMATLGIRHVERNGHHYFRGLSMHSPEVQQRVLAAHGGLYHRVCEGYPTLRISAGELRMSSVNTAPFGCGMRIDVEAFEPLAAWIKRGGMGELDGHS